jgi:predicted ester cyclase
MIAVSVLTKMRWAPALMLCAGIGLSGAPAQAESVNDAKAYQATKPRELIVEQGRPKAQVAQMLRPVDALYAFWDNGDAALLKPALADGFTDHTLPPGRPQGPGGPPAAMKAFSAAVPDIRLAVLQRLVVGDRVVSHLRFTGHFTGAFKGRRGQGQPIDFIATDILRIKDGRITDNWHLEDNLTFLQQVGAVAR